MVAFKFKLRLTKRQKLSILLLFAVLLAATIGALGLELAYADKVPPRVKIGTLALGGMSREQAKQALQQTVAGYRDDPIAVSLGEDSWSVTASDLNIQFLIDPTLDDLFGSGSRIAYIARGSRAAVQLEFDQTKLDEYFSRIAKVTDDPSADASLKITDTQVVELPEKIGRGIDRALLKREFETRLGHLSNDPIILTIKTLEPNVYREGLADAKRETDDLVAHKLTVSAAGQGFVIDREEITNFITYETADPLVGGKGKALKVKLSEDKLREWVKKIAKKVDQPIREARLKLEGERVSVFTSSQEGKTLDKDKSVLLVKSKLDHFETTVELPVDIKKPGVTTESVNDLGIKELIGKATTSFKGSPQNRKHNIGNGSRFLNGILIRPGEVFSTVEQLGKIDDTTGYLPELVIKENQTIPEFGGGLCQVSTTLFRAALNSGLPIVERQNHSWRIRYYEPPVGLDATVYLPKPDLKIKNDTPGWILVQGFIQGDSLTFEFYGSKDGRRSEIIGPKLLSSTAPPPDVYLETADLPAGEVKQVEKPHPGGKTTATYKVFNQDGSQRNEQTFNSSYKAVPARFLKGTGPQSAQPSPEPSPSPSPESTPTPTRSPESTPSPSPTP
ncbi:MAG: VanW family protein [Patescibacteria group bacterium]